MKTRSAAKITLTAMFLSLAAACSEPEPRADYTQWCQDPDTEIRVADEECERASSSNGVISVNGHPVRRRWAYSGSAPAIGSKAPSYTTVRPTTGTIGRVPASGGFGTFKGGSTGG